MIKLFPYQERVLEAIDLDSSHSQLISMPTGTGKTITFLSVAKNRRVPCLILVHREELLHQTREKALLVGFKEEQIAVISAEKKDDFKILNIAMVQTLNRNLEKYAPDSVRMMIVDEAHHSTAASYKSIFSHFRIFEEKKLILGFTATPLRGDSRSLQSVYFSHSFKMTLSEATQQGYICPVHGIRVEIDRSLEDIDSQQGDYDISQLDKIMNCQEINNIVVDRCEHLGKNPSIVFCTSVDHAQILAKMLRKKKRKAISVSYLTPKKTLSKIYEMLKNKKIDFITNAVKLSEGFDFPPIQSIILVRPTRSPVLYKQMIGRGLRNSPDKYDCLVMEFSGNDKNMICWEDIDENCTFQSSNPNERVSREQSLALYKGKFTSPNLKVLDVRISPFEFYECRLRRIEKYKNYFYMPHIRGFSLFEMRVKRRLDCEPGFNLLGFECCWKKKYKSFSMYGEPWFLYEKTDGYPMSELKRMLNYYSERQMGGYGRWYPSENEPINREQKLMLKTNQKLSARKAEMMIEDKSIKKCIEDHFINGEPRGLMEIQI